MRTTPLKYGSIGVLALLLGGFLGTIMPDEFDKLYICPLTQQIAMFERLSRSGKTGYWVDENGTTRMIQCRIGRNYEPWQKLSDYAAEHDLDLSSVIARSLSSSGATLPRLNFTGIKCEVCNTTGCYPVKCNA